MDKHTKLYDKYGNVFFFIEELPRDKVLVALARRVQGDVEAYLEPSDTFVTRSMSTMFREPLAK